MPTTHKEVPDNRLLLRLCCWHDSKIDESTKQNTKLCRSFNVKELEPDWALEIVTPSIRNDRTKIVPISIQFRHRSLNPFHEDAPQHSWSLWNAIIKPTVKVFFEAEKISPIVVALYALDDDLAPDVRIKFSHYEIKEEWKCKIKARVHVPPKPSTGWRFSIKALLGFGKQAVDTTDRLGRQFQAEGQQHKSSGIPLESQSQGPGPKAGTTAQQKGRAQSSQSGQCGGKQAQKIDIDQTKATLESIFKLGSAVDALVQENEAHHKALADDINTNHQRLGNPMVVFESTMNDILAGLNSIVVKEASNPQQTDPSASMAMTDINAGPLHITSQVMRNMMKVNSIVEENLDKLLAAIKHKHDSEVQTWQYITGGLALVVYAGGCYFFPALPIYAWVTGGFAISTVAVGGAAGTALTGYGGKRWWVKEVEKAKKRRDNVTDNFNNLKRVLNRYFAIVAIRYYEEVLHIPFQELNDIEKRQCLIEFGLDADLVHKKAYTDAKIEKGAEELGLAEDNFKKSFEVLLKDEGLSSIKRSYV